MKLVVGRKLNMTQFFNEDGSVVPVTVIKVKEGFVTQIKTENKDGYSSVQVGFDEGKKNPSKALVGHVAEKIAKPKLFEFKPKDTTPFKVGDKINLSTFSSGDLVCVTGVSKGRGFTGVVKRYNFKGSPKSHGHKHDLRAPGSIGSTDAQRVFPGKRMAGRSGGGKVTIKNLEIAKIDQEKGLLMIKGAVPGPRNGILIVSMKENSSKIKQL